VKLPLFISAKPTVGQKSMTVMIGPGTWKIENSDSSTKLDYFVNNLPVPGSIIVVDSISKVYGVVVESGSQSINIALAATN